MATPKWEPSKLYPPGSLVLPRTAPTSGYVVINNAGFETGDATGWDLDSGASISGAYKFAGAYACRFDGATGITRVTSDEYTCAPFVSITAACMYGQGAADKGHNKGRVFLEFRDATHAMISRSYGNEITSSSGGWKKSSVTAQSPANTAYVCIGGEVNRDRNAGSAFDSFSWDLLNVVTSGLQYKAVQSAIGFSDSVEPVWPGTVGVQVIDNEVIWEAVLMSRLVWRARPILKSGATEPIWPEQPGDIIADNTIAWVTTDMRVTDPKLPLGKYVTIARYKIFVGAGDTVAYCATLNANDWHTEKDAGFLGTGLIENGANEARVLNLYRGNLVVMNAPMFQQWQIDPDPELMDLLDTMPGIGSVWHLAAVPVANDMFYLSSLGVRTIGISGATNNLRAGDVGLPIDTLVQDRVRRLLENETDPNNPAEQPLGTYFTSSGQYWLCFNFVAPAFDADDYEISTLYRALPRIEEGDAYCEVFVYTLNQTGQVGAWTRYLFPFRIDYIVQKGTDLFARDGDHVYRLSEELGAVDLLSTDFEIAGDVPDGNVGSEINGAYSGSGGIPPYGPFTVTSGTFPPGLTLNANGTYSGNYTTAGTYNWTIGAVDSIGNADEIPDSAIVESSGVVTVMYRASDFYIQGAGMETENTMRLEVEYNFGNALPLPNGEVWWIFDGGFYVIDSYTNTLLKAVYDANLGNFIYNEAALYMAYSAANDMVYVAWENGAIHKFDATTREEVGTIAGLSNIGNSIPSITLHVDETTNTLWAYVGSAGTLQVFDLATDTLLTTFNDQYVVQAVRGTVHDEAHGRYLLWDGFEYEYRVFDIATRTLAQTISTGGSGQPENWPEWIEPDGNGDYLIAGCDGNVMYRLNSSDWTFTEVPLAFSSYVRVNSNTRKIYIPQYESGGATVPDDSILVYDQAYTLLATVSGLKLGNGWLQSNIDLVDNRYYFMEFNGDVHYIDNSQNHVVRPLIDVSLQGTNIVNDNVSDLCVVRHPVVDQTYSNWLQRVQCPEHYWIYREYEFDPTFTRDERSDEYQLVAIVPAASPDVGYVEDGSIEGGRVGTINTDITWAEGRGFQIQDAVTASGWSTSGFSYSGWMNFEVPPVGEGYAPTVLGAAFNGEGVELWVGEGATLFDLYYYGGGSGGTAEVPAEFNQWHHLAVRATPNAHPFYDFEIFWDGELMVTRTGVNVTSPDASFGFIGVDGANEGLSGLIGNTAFFSRVLTDQEILDQYNTGMAGIP